MAEISKTEFIKNLRASRIVTDQQLDAQLAQISSDDTRQVAAALAKSQIITDWQAKFLLSGRSRLRVGNYILLDRLNRDELGDQFLAWHEPLHRKVDLQILAGDFGRESPQFPTFIDSTARLTRLDHPHLIHVYDVGAEKKRFYVVCEHIVGKVMPVESVSRMDRVHTIRFVRDIASAIQYAHANGVAHGSLNSGSLMSDRDGHGKIVRLAQAVLQAEVFSPAASQSLVSRKSNDLRVLLELASAGFEHAFANGKMAAAKGLLSVVADRPEQLSNLVGELDSWLAEHDSGPKSEYDFATEEARLTVSASVSKTINQAEKTKTVPLASQAAMPPASRKLRQYASLAAIVLLLIFVVGWKFWPFSNSYFGDSAATRSEVDSREIASQAIAKRQSNKRNATKSANTTTKSANKTSIVFNEGADFESKSSGKPIPNAFVASVEGNPISNPATPDSAQELSTINTEKTTLTVQETKTQDPANQVNDPFKIPGAASKSPSGELVDPTNKNSPTAASENTSIARLPFAALTQSLSLGSPGNNEIQSIGAIQLANAAELKMELLHDPESVGKSRIFFVLEPMSETASWSVSTKKRADATEKENVGQFSWSDGQLRYQWDEKLDEKSNAASIANAVLKLQIGEQVKFCQLRSPVMTQSLSLDPKTLAGQISVDVPNSPNEKFLRIEFANFHQENGWPNVTVENLGFENKKPAFLFFKAAEEERLFGIVINRDFKAKLRVEAELHHFQAGTSRRIKPEELQTGMGEVENQYAFLAAEVERTNAIAASRPYRKITESEENARAAKNSLDAFRKNRELYSEYRDLIGQLPDREIPFRVVYQFGDHVVELAKSPSFDSANKSASDAATSPAAIKPDEREKK